MSKLLEFILTSTLTSGVLVLLLAFRSKKARQAGWLHILTYPWTLKLFGIFGSVLLLTGIMHVFMNTDLNEALVCTGIVSPILVLVICGTLEVLFFQITFDARNVIQNSPWSTSKQIRLNNIVSVQFSSFTNQYIVTDAEGSKIRFTKYLSGHGQLLGEIQKLLV